MREHLRKAGRKIADMDKAYGQKVGDFIAGDPKNWKDRKRDFIRATLGAVSEAQYGDVEVNFKKEPKFWGKVGAEAFKIGIPTAGVGIRYGIPAAGVALAGKGLIDLTSQLNQMTDQQTGSEISMDTQSMV